MANYLPLGGTTPEKSPLGLPLKIVGKIQNPDLASRKKSTSSGKQYVHLQVGNDTSDVNYVPIKVKELAKVLNINETQLKSDINKWNTLELNKEINSSFKAILKPDGKIELVRNQRELSGTTVRKAEQPILKLGKGKPVGPKKKAKTNPDKSRSYHLKQTITGVTPEEAHEIALLKSRILKSDFDEYAGHADLSPKEAHDKYIELNELRNKIKEVREKAAKSVKIEANRQGITEQSEIDKLITTKKKNFDRKFEENPWKVIRDIDYILKDLKP